jgi:hypothetical protein
VDRPVDKAKPVAVRRYAHMRNGDTEIHKASVFMPVADMS